jgi:GT2 family glycosyltransferase/glycosyltransferase involved in cell wall biosynthesis
VIWDCFPQGILASCVNGGGVFRVTSSGIACLSARDTTGMCAWQGGLLLARQNPGTADIGIVDDHGMRNVRLNDHALDLHDALWHDGVLYLVATQTNTVSAFDAELRETRRWVFEGEPDSQHINSVCVHEGRLLASRFGDFRQHRAYKGQTRGAGQVFDVNTGEVILQGLSQPHSLRSRDGLLWLCDSESGRILAYCGSRLVREFAVGGYARGLMFTDDCMLVGLSRSRNATQAGVERACVVAVDKGSGRELARIELPAPEIYDLHPSPAALPDVSQDALAEARLLIEETAHARNVASASAHEWKAIADERARDVESLRRSVKTQADREHQARMQMREADAWSRLLETEIGALRSRHDAVQALMRGAVETALVAQRAIEAQAGAISARDGFIDLLRGSRTWRWTRRLRRREPVAPPPSEPMEMPTDMLACTREQLLQALSEGPVPAADNASVQIEGIRFEEQERPDVSVLVTAYGQYEETRACLDAIARCGDATSFEVLLIEDASLEARMDRFATVPGLRYIKNPVNVGFLRSVNAAAKHARGRYLVMLNNDTRVRPGWLDALRRSFTLLDGCGLAGSKLVYPDGRLQEAGGIVWSDATGCNVGRGDDPNAAAYAAARPVDYVSGASIMIETELFHAIGGFDERFAPAYYEDTDLAFQVRRRGFRVYFQPESVVEHLEGLTHGTDEGSGTKAAQARNRLVFQEKWRGELERTQFQPGEHFVLARERAQLSKSILVVDHHAPRCDEDAGSRAMWTLLRTLQRMGFRVRFWSLAENEHESYADSLRRHGVEVNVGSPAALSDWLRLHGIYVDNVVLSRPAVAQVCLNAVRALTRATVVFYGHDIHHLRIGGHARLSADPGRQREAEVLKGIEEEIWRRSDVILYPTDEETATVQAWLDSNAARARASTIPLLAFDGELAPADATESGLERRNEVFFVGNYRHAPNEDGIVWFAQQAWPSIRAAHPSLRLVVAGAGVTEVVAELGKDSSIEVVGALSDEDLHAHYLRARVAIAPLRFGAGLKGKVVEAMRYGVPVVATSVGAQGLRDAACISVANDAEAFVDAVSRLATGADIWREASGGGQRYVAERFTTERIAQVLHSVLDSEHYPSVQARLERIAQVTGQLALGGEA